MLLIPMRHSVEEWRAALRNQVALRRHCSISNAQARLRLSDLAFAVSTVDLSRAVGSILAFTKMHERSGFDQFKLIGAK
jgi:hypothetical protein